MVRAQIQLPDPLYKEVQRIARQQNWSIAEVIRRGAEAVVRSYPADKRDAETPAMPPALRTRLLVIDPEALRDLIQTDSERR
jgi:hypothetical protein